MLQQAKQRIEQADFILIGAGAGFSAAAGLTYSGERFTQRFQPFIQRYSMQDMYSAGFYPFETEEEKWAYWAEHIWANRFEPPALPLYQQLFALVKDKNYFVITTNVDSQFAKAGFDLDKLFEVQGNYGELQCAKPCHSQVYDNETLVQKWRSQKKIVKFLPHLCRNVRYAAAKWQCIYGSITALLKQNNGIPPNSVMPHLPSKQYRATLCIWNWGLALTPRALFVTLLSR